MAALMPKNDKGTRSFPTSDRPDTAQHGGLCPAGRRNTRQEPLRVLKMIHSAFLSSLHHHSQSTTKSKRGAVTNIEHSASLPTVSSMDKRVAPGLSSVC